MRLTDTQQQKAIIYNKLITQFNTVEFENSKHSSLLPNSTELYDAPNTVKSTFNPYFTIWWPSEF